MNHDTLIARGWPIDRGKGKNLQYKVEVNGVYLRPNPIVQWWKHVGDVVKLGTVDIIVSK